MTIPFAHTGHWLLNVIYIAPVVLIALGLWWSGRREDQRKHDDDRWKDERWDDS